MTSLIDENELSVKITIPMVNLRRLDEMSKTETPGKEDRIIRNRSLQKEQTCQKPLRGGSFFRRGRYKDLSGQSCVTRRRVLRVSRWMNKDKREEEEKEDAFNRWRVGFRVKV